MERRPVGDLSGTASDQMTGATEMEVLYPRCSGIDGHKRFLVVCLSIVQTNGQRHKELRQFSTLTSEILVLKEWLKASGCRQIAMESTGGVHASHNLAKSERRCLKRVEKASD